MATGRIKSMEIPNDTIGIRWIQHLNKEAMSGKGGRWNLCVKRETPTNT